jgi:hypothetical protein
MTLYLPWRVITTHAHYMLAVAYLALSVILSLLTQEQKTVSS